MTFNDDDDDDNNNNNNVFKRLDLTDLLYVKIQRSVILMHER